jgi:hypothetical protein
VPPVANRGGPCSKHSQAVSKEVKFRNRRNGIRTWEAKASGYEDVDNSDCITVLQKRDCCRSKLLQGPSMCLGNTPKSEFGRSYNTRRGPVALFLPRLKLDHCRFRGTSEKMDQQPSTEKNSLLLLVRFLYMIRCPHSLQRIGSRGLISFFAPQSVLRKGLVLYTE